MTRTVVTSSLMLLALATTALARETVWTAGPIALCESDAIMLAAHNPGDQTVNARFELLDLELGRAIDALTLGISPGGGAAVWYQQGRVVLDADLNPSEAGCTRPRLVVARASAQSALSFRGVLPGAKSLRALLVNPVTPGKDRPTVSKPAAVDLSRSQRLRLVNLGDQAVTLTYELVNTVSGAAVVRRTVRLEAFGTSGGLECGGACDFVTTEPESRTTKPTPGMYHVAVNGQGFPSTDVDVAVSLTSGEPEDAGYNFIESWPCKWKGFTLDGK